MNTRKSRGSYLVWVSSWLVGEIQLLLGLLLRKIVFELKFLTEGKLKESNEEKRIISNGLRDEK